MVCCHSYLLVDVKYNLWALGVTVSDVVRSHLTHSTHSTHSKPLTDDTVPVVLLRSEFRWSKLELLYLLVPSSGPSDELQASPHCS